MNRRMILLLLTTLPTYTWSLSKTNNNQPTKILDINKEYSCPNYSHTTKIILWQKLMTRYLSAPLWNEMYAYDAGQTLMIPLHAAFMGGNTEWQNNFHAHFSAYAKDEKNWAKGRLNKLHYQYLASRYLVLSGETNTFYTSNIAENLKREIIDIWLKQPSWQWDHSAFHGMRERINWKLQNKSTKKSYYRAIIDEELFVFAIAADLTTYSHICGGKIPEPLEDILDLASKVFDQRVEWQSDGSWLFQPGVWSDHPDYAYAGQTQMIPGMEKKRVSNIAEDVSHSNGLPVWLTSLAMAQKKGSSSQNRYLHLKKRLEYHMFKTVFVPPSISFPFWRATNFMDGSNGVYRWNYNTAGKDNGYGPYELSGTLIVGWWPFLGGKRTHDMYHNISKSFPLPPQAVKLYIGPDTTRKRHEIVTSIHPYCNGFYQLLTSLGSDLTPHLLASDR